MPLARSLANRWLPVLAWMTLIFIASADTESGFRGSRLLAPVIRFLVPDISQMALEQTVLFVRKCVHFGTFGVLAALFYRALAARQRSTEATPIAAATASGRHLPSVPAGLAWKAWSLTVLYAMSDEIHQTFVPQRTGTVTDVVIDAAGAACVVLILHTWRRRMRR